MINSWLFSRSATTTNQTQSKAEETQQIGAVGKSSHPGNHVTETRLTVQINISIFRKNVFINEQRRIKAMTAQLARRKVPTSSLHARSAASLLRVSIEVRLFPPPRGMVSELKRPAPCFSLSGRVTGLTLEKDQQQQHAAPPHTHTPPSCW